MIDGRDGDQMGNGNGVDIGDEAASLEQHSMDLKFRPYSLH